MSEPGWVIDYEADIDLDIASRKGWGQTLEEARVMASSFVNRVEIDTGLDPKAVEKPVRFKIKDEDGHVYYGGVVRQDWLDGTNEDGEDYAYFIQKFGEADVGATDVVFRAADLEGTKFLATHRGYNLIEEISGEEWVIVY